ncbi:uncharacterized protein ARB_05191 [Trichophyton benhamiae CBS 112371]|uniref:Uncharacterized protein n=1 Tax=Arthroderma benhamiae (strain ATCC MYA-4681 / CBS 112371) TaxID=663331 RepID=D4ALJ3_ARTBC|nr:uncharacterized protein ARB_05191 [Trichophyton benhamiae CBS 112371]EFE36252.1 hypothetical protein ARB_05191 [Trichophyton benhamiae CBS 112371]
MTAGIANEYFFNFIFSFTFASSTSLYLSLAYLRLSELLFPLDWLVIPPSTATV